VVFVYVDEILQDELLVVYVLYQVEILEVVEEKEFFLVIQ
jgi:hypothetical protein